MVGLRANAEDDGLGVLGRLDRWLDPLSPSTIERGTIVGVLLFAAIDLALGQELSFSFFYLLPIGFAAWYGRERAGYFLALFAAGVWFVTELFLLEPAAAPFVLGWNMGVRFGIFLLMAALTARLRESLDRQRELAHSDSLTGLPNTRAFVARLEAEIDRAGRYGRIFTLAYLDLDHFKEVNDTFGHAVGDEVLITVAETMRATMRTTDVPARLGGDEFGLLLPETPFAQADWALGKLRDELLRVMGSRGWPVTVSIGAVTFEVPARSPDEAIGIADRVMYDVKSAGRDAVLHILWTGDAAHGEASNG